MKGGMYEKYRSFHMKNNHLSGPVKVTKNTEKLATKLIIRSSIMNENQIQTSNTNNCSCLTIDDVKSFISHCAKDPKGSGKILTGVGVGVTVVGLLLWKS